MIPRLAACLLAGIFAYNTYRAASISLTTDEAYTYFDYVSQPVSTTLTGPYSANNHVLYTLLAQASVALFGVSELSLRLPALAGALLYLTALWLMGRRFLAETGRLPAFVLLASLHPTVFDFLSLARGYGAALGCWWIGWYLSLQKREWWAGAALGLAVAFNLVFLVPVCAVLLVARSWRAAAAAAATGIPLLAVPLSKATLGDYYFGASTAAQSVQSVLGVEHQPVLSSILIAISALGLFLAWRCGDLPRQAVIVAALCAAALGAAHLAWNLPLPYRRTGLYWVPISFACALAIVPRKAGWAAALAASLAIPGFLKVSSPVFYETWRFNASDRRIVAQIRQQPESGQPVAASHALRHTLRFYLGREIAGLEEPGAARFWVLIDEDAKVIQERRLQVLSVDGATGVTLARLPDPVHLH